MAALYCAVIGMRRPYAHFFHFSPVNAASHPDFLGCHLQDSCNSFLANAVRSCGLMCIDLAE